MGFFSWKTSDTDKSISNMYSSRGTFPVYVLIPEEFGGGHIEERCYGGYGEFGGQDIYALVARWNKPELCNGDDEHDRHIGIDIACYDEQNASLKYPIKITERPIHYSLAEPSVDCEHQGFFYEDDEPCYEDDEEWIEEEYDIDWEEDEEDE